MARERVSIAELLERLRAARHEGDVIASDGDGTLWRGDIGETLFEAALADRALRDDAGPALSAEAERFEIAASADPHGTAAALYEAQKAGRYPDRAAYAMMAWCFAGYTEGELRSYADEVLDRSDFEASLRSFTRRLVEFADEAGHSFWLVSASPLAVVQAAAARLGLAPERCVAMLPATEGGVLLPRLAAEATYAEGKVRRLRDVTKAPLLAGLGDSLYDAALISEARVGVAVCPKPELEAALGPGSLVLEE